MGRLLTSRTNSPVIYARGVPDPFWDDVTSLLRYSEANGTTATTADEISGNTWTLNSANPGSESIISSGNPKFGNNLLNQRGGGLDFSATRCAYASLGTIDLTATDITIDTWVYVIDWEDDAPLFHLGDRGSNSIQSWIVEGGGSIKISANGLSTQTLATSISLNTWNHYAMVKKTSGAWSVYWNGEEIGSGTGITFNGTKTMHWGYTRGVAFTHFTQDMRFDDSRVTLAERYTGDFALPSAEASTYSG